MTERLSLAELSESSGVPPRTIRYYIARGILAGPDQAGRNARYDRQHLRRLREISKLKQKGLTLSEIAVRLSGGRAESELPSPATWLQFAISDDVSVLVRSDVAPWRMRRIRRWLAETSRRLEEPREKED
jgi:DNA-binding transcriptional MerR regulator